MTVITSHSGGATSTQVRELEATLGRELPGDYRQFLLEYNGGVPSPEVFRIQGSAHFDYDQIDYFLGVAVDESYLNILWTLDAMSDRLLPGYVPIAAASAGTMLLLCTNAPGFGSVSYWDPQDLAKGGGLAIWPVAASFSALLASLQESPES